MLFVGYYAAIFIAFIVVLAFITVLSHFWPLLLVGAVVWIFVRLNRK